MSLVTDVLLIFDLVENYRDASGTSPYSLAFTDEENEFMPDPDQIPGIQNINNWLTENHKGRLDRLDDRVKSGGKTLGAYVYGGAFNFLNVLQFVSLIRSQSWHHPERVLLLVKNPETFTFEIINMS